MPDILKWFGLATRRELRMRDLRIAELIAVRRLANRGSPKVLEALDLAMEECRAWRHADHQSRYGSTAGYLESLIRASQAANRNDRFNAIHGKHIHPEIGEAHA